MCHAQEGPNPLPGLCHPPGFSGVDLVFPAFLFAMGAAFPFALSRRLARGASHTRLLLGVVMRGALLVASAIYLQHTVPFVVGITETNRGHWVGLVALLLLFPIFTRIPTSLGTRTT